MRTVMTQAVATIDSCFGLVKSHQHGIAVGQKIGLQALCTLPFFAEAGAKHPFKHQLHMYTTHVARPWVGVRVCHLLLLLFFSLENLSFSFPFLTSFILNQLDYSLSISIHEFSTNLLVVQNYVNPLNRHLENA